MDVDVVVNENAQVCVFHNKPFEKDLSWLEYDLDTHTLNFILDDGDIRDIGRQLDPQISGYMQNAHLALVVLTGDTPDDIIGGVYMPLVCHRSYN